MDCGVVAAKVPHDQVNFHVEMEEANKEGIGFVIIDFGLSGLIWVRFLDPLEVIVG